MYRIMIVILAIIGLCFQLSCNRNSQTSSKTNNSSKEKKWSPVKLKWITFDLSAGGNKKGSIKDYKILINQAKPPDDNTPFERDYLKLEIKHPKKDTYTHRFRSSYGRGKVTIVENFLIVQWGLGRGTNARAKNIKIFKLGSVIPHYLMNVKKSSILSVDSESLKAKEVEYSLQIKKWNQRIKLIFKQNSEFEALPKKKTVIIQD